MYRVYFGGHLKFKGVLYSSKYVYQIGRSNLTSGTTLIFLFRYPVFHWLYTTGSFMFSVASTVSTHHSLILLGL